MKSYEANRLTGYLVQMNQSTTLVSKLTISWPDVKKVGNDITFWREQWDKHGTCSQQKYKQTDYFERSHEMWNTHNVTEILNRAGIIPNGTMRKYVDIEGSIQAAIQTKIPLLRCKNVTRSNISRLHEIVICYAHNGSTLTDCIRTEATCPKTTAQIQFQ